jgi:P27 family predicted phage terminase small subunit
MPTPRKSNAAHFLSDTKSQAKIDVRSQIVAGRPKFPRHLSIGARKEFKRVCVLLEDRGVLTEGDVMLISLYAEVADRWITCKSELGKELMIVHEFLDSNGACHSARRLNPLLKVAQSCEARLQALAKELSLTPLMRDKARVTSESSDREIVPGSLAETNPEMFDKSGRLKVITMPSAEELAALDAKENGVN